MHAWEATSRILARLSRSQRQPRHHLLAASQRLRCAAFITRYSVSAFATWAYEDQRIQRLTRVLRERGYIAADWRFTTREAWDRSKYVTMHARLKLSEPHLMALHELLTVARETPHDPTPRLLAADWLEERGETARSEWIRLGCELDQDHRRLAGEQRSRRTESLNRQADLLDEYESQWLGDWKPALLDWGWRWGFLDWVALTVDAFLDRGWELLQQHPVQRVHIVADEARNELDGYSIHRVTRAPAFALVRACDIAPPKDSWDDSMMLADWLIQLAESPHVNLRRLESSARFAPESGEELQQAWGRFCNAERLGKLESLRLTIVSQVATIYESETPSAADIRTVFAYGETLANAVFASNLRELTLGDEISRRDVLALCGGALPSLKRLWITPNFGMRDVLSQMLHAPFPNLRGLMLPRHMLGQFAASRLARQVRELDIVGTDLLEGESDRDWEQLLDVAPSPDKLSLLDTNPSDFIWNRIGQQDWLRDTRTLDAWVVGHRLQRGTGLLHAMEQGALQGLRQLILRGLYGGASTNARDIAQAMIDSPGFEDLEALSLYDFGLGEVTAGEAAISALGSQTPNLRRLSGVQLHNRDAVRQFALAFPLEQLEDWDCTLFSPEDDPSDLNLEGLLELLRSERLRRVRTLKLEFRNMQSLAENTVTMMGDPRVLPGLHSLHLELSSDQTWVVPSQWGSVPVTVRERLGPRIRLS